MTKIMYVPVNTRWMAWSRASIRRDLRTIGALDGEETDEERRLLEEGPDELEVRDSDQDSAARQ